MMDKLATDLTRILGPGRLLWEREHLATYGFDGTAALYAEAGCVALPKTTAEVTQVVRYAAQNKIPVVTRGSAVFCRTCFGVVGESARHSRMAGRDRHSRADGLDTANGHLP